MASSSSSAAGATYQAFLSFRGPDTRQGFADVLYHALSDAGIRVFRDDEEIRKGEEIGEEIRRGIEDSRIFVPIFSKGYASSKWCLVELTEMMKLKKGSRGKRILPVFYDVAVDDVKLKTDLYSKALKDHADKFGAETVQEWRKSLQKAGKIKGWELKNTGHGEFSRLFVREVSRKLKVKHKLVTEFLIQRDDQVGDLMKLLDIKSSDVRFVGIYGMGGIGKTTLAKVVFNKLCDHFDCCSFLADVRESSRPHKGIECLQKQLLESAGIKSEGIRDAGDGIISLRETLVQKKALIVLDDVDHMSQILHLAGDASWFGSGSRIIITSRDQRVLRLNQLRIQTLEVEEMKTEEARRLLCMHAFQKDSPPSDYNRLSDAVVASTGRLPLALEVIGSHLRDKPLKDWIHTIGRLKKVPHQDVQEKLMISYEALNPETRQIFLDIACFFIDHEKRYPMYMWEACNFDPEMGLKELVYMSLVKIIVKEPRHPLGVKQKKVWMHDQLRDLGRKVVYDESFRDVVRRSRIWRHEDALEILQEEEGKENVEMLRLCYNEQAEGHIFTQRELSSLRKLRYLECFGGNFSGELKHALTKLRWLSWHYCPPEFKGTNLGLSNLVVLDLSESDVSEDWSGWTQIGAGSKLKVLDLTGCKRLIRTPDLSTYSGLESLILADCSNLVEMHLSIGKLKGLKHLDVSRCYFLKGFPPELCSLHSLEVVLRHGKTSYWRFKEVGRFDMPELIGDVTSLLIFEVHQVQIVKLPQSIGKLARLRRLSLAGCSGMEKLPDTLADMTSLVEMNLSWTDVSELPQMIGRLVKLELLSLERCEKMKKLPVSIGNLKSLLELDVSWSGITKLPDTVGNLKRLRVMTLCRSNIKELPTSIGMLKRLEELDASYTRLREIPTTIEGLTCLSVLNLESTSVSLIRAKLPAGLTDVRISSPWLQRFPEFSNLHNLARLFIEDYQSEEARVQLPPHRYRIFIKPHALAGWHLRLRNVTSLPEELSCHSQLKHLILECPNLQHCPPLPYGLSTLELVGLGERTKLPRLSDLENLLTLALSYCCIIHDTLGNLGVGELESLMRLDLRHCEFRNLDGLQLPKNLQHLEIEFCKDIEALPALSHLKSLKILKIERAEKLVEIRELGKLKPLQRLNISSCGSIERLPNLSKLKTLTSLNTVACPKFVGIDVIHELKSLEFLSIKGCACKDVETTFPGRVQKESKKRHFENLD